jgi:acetyl esterase/lipase
MGVVQYGASPAQQADLHLSGAAGAPVVCLLHGGFWRAPHGRDQLDVVAADLVARGYAVLNIGYRRVGDAGGGWPGTLDDVVLAVEHLAQLADTGVAMDRNRIVIAGHSAGGQLALAAAARLRTSTRVPVRAVASLAGVLDLERAFALGSGNGAVHAFLDATPAQGPDRYAQASPIALLPLHLPQLVLHGARDTVLPIELAERYVDRARSLGEPVEFPQLPDSGHMDFVDPTSHGHQCFAEWLARVVATTTSPA